MRFSERSSSCRRWLQQFAVATLAVTAFTTLPVAPAHAGPALVGACCSGVECIPDQTPSSCDLQFGGSYQGDNSTCSPINPCIETNAVCGNFQIEAPETCDDGNTMPGDGCDQFCQTEYCGDGTTNNYEQCDDGGTAAGDGCGPACLFEECGNHFVDPGEQCDDGNTTDGDGCNGNCLFEYCGDGSVNDCYPLLSLNGQRPPLGLCPEQCDDGNTVDGDGCNSKCLSEYCGDGITNDGGAEQCDDGSTANGDGCNELCQLEYCGDGVNNNNGSEQCDDGNTTGGDGCSASCQQEYCGDGVVSCFTPRGRTTLFCETCDDGGTTAGDGCNEYCQLETCGDGIVNNDGTEQCDDGNTNPNDSCTDCQYAECGDGVINLIGGEVLEQCDDGNTTAGDGCDSGCTLEVCGDEIVNNNTETCDDGNTNSNDDCVNCAAASCGDGELHTEGTPPFEECDDGNTDDSDFCSGCKVAYCGDGIVNTDGNEVLEQCDDGDTTPGDGCSENCVTEYCGDGITNNNTETCDDGNTAAGDGCDSACILETGACCTPGSCSDLLESACAEIGGGFAGVGTSCSQPAVCCGDGSLQEGEECDTGGGNDPGCSASCTVEDCYACVDGKGGSVCSPDVGASCDDGEICTLGDECNANADCVGAPTIIPAACDWVMVAGNAEGRAQARTRGNVIVLGDICGNKTRIGEVAAITGDVVATADSGIGSQWGAAATVDGDVITGGASVSGRPKDVLLPGLDVTQVAGGSSAVQTGDPADEYDTTGASTRVDDCQAAIDSIPASASLLDGLTATDSRGKVQLGNLGSLQIDATGPVNVVDFDKLIAGDKSTITLNGNNIAGVTFILRVTKKMYIHLQSDVVLTGGADASRVIIYGKSLCKLGQRVVGGGTIFCPNNKLKVDQISVWDGALISGKKRIDLRHQADLTHVPLQVGIP